MSEELRRKLKAARTKLGLTQDQAAKIWGIPQRTLISWENDERTPTGYALKSITEMLDQILSE